MLNLTGSERDKLMSDLKGVIADAEELLRSTAGQAGEDASELRRRIQARLTRTKEGLEDLQAAAVEQARAAGQAADDYVHENPWRSVVAAAGIGFAVGLLISRR